MNRHTRQRLLSFAAAAVVASGALAQDVSQPAMLQWFESSWQTMEKRAPDLFMAGYGSVWTPPPSRAEQGNLSVGYDVWDRFDLGSTGNYTLYGSETGIKSMVSMTHRLGARVYTDLVLNHNGFLDRLNNGFAAAGSYPGFAVTLPGDIDGDFHDQTYSGSDDYLLRIGYINSNARGLIDIAQEKNHLRYRSPVTAGDPNNIPAGTTSFNGRTANVPTVNNRRFYPDQALGGTVYFDPTTGTSFTSYDFNTADPAGGDAVLETAQDYLMRNARWMIQTIGVDGFRLDAVKHFPPSVLNRLDRAVWKSIKAPLLNGQQQHVFSFSEAFDGSRSLLQSYIKKNAGQVTGNTVGGNRDALDFPLFFAMRDNLSSNGLANDWRNVVNASQDVQDDGLANNGSQGVSFVQSHDEFGPVLTNVAHAYALMRPGNAIVYFNAKEFGTNRSFPKDGRGDALGGFYGDRATRLVNIRNTHGRGNYIPRVLEKELLAYEREKSAVVFLNNRGDSGFDTRTIQTSFAPGTKLIDLTGNATNAAIDPTNAMPDVVTVNASGQVTLTVPRNANSSGTITDNGYVIYGLPTPVGSISVSNVSGTLAGGTPTAGTNGTTRLTSMDVVTANSFSITLNTIPVVLPDSTIDAAAGGDRAYVRVNGGIDLNGTGTVDFVNPADTRYGFENFLTGNSPLFGGGSGVYVQTIDATGLPEGPNYIEARAYRQRADGGPDVFSSFRKVVYVDRLDPVTQVESVVTLGGGTIQFRARNIDQTADSVHFLLNQVGSQTEAQALALVSAGNKGGPIDRDLFAYGFNPNAMRSGNQVITTITFEPTGNSAVKRDSGHLVIIPGRGLGLGDMDGSNSYTTADISGPQGIEFLVYPNFAGATNHTFGLPGPAADLDGNGLLDTRDLLALRPHYIAINAPSAVIAEARSAEVRRGNTNQTGPTDAADIDFVFSQIGQTSNIWRSDLNVDGAVTLADVDLLLARVFLTRYGDANLDATVSIGDFSLLAANFNQPAGWAGGNFNGDANVSIGDFALLAANFNQSGPVASMTARSVPEPAGLLGLWGAGLAIRRRRR